LAKPLPAIEWIAPHIVTHCCYHFFKLGRRKECWKKANHNLTTSFTKITIFNSHENKQTNKQINKQAIVFAQEVKVIIFAQQVEVLSCHQFWMMIKFAHLVYVPPNPCLIRLDQISLYMLFWHP
jgi:hypothetical protein